MLGSSRNKVAPEPDPERGSPAPEICRLRMVPVNRGIGLDGSGFREGRLFSGSTRHKHNDFKSVFEGMGGISLQVALNHTNQVKSLLRRSPLAVAATAQAANAKDVDGDRHPLHWAAARGHMRCLELLLQAGASVNVLDAEGRTPAELASKCGAEEAMAALDAWARSTRRRDGSESGTASPASSSFSSAHGE